jgi:hypothetical protein
MGDEFFNSIYKQHVAAGVRMGRKPLNKGVLFILWLRDLPPRDRVFIFMERITRCRTLSVEQSNNLLLKLAHKLSGRPSYTYEALQSDFFFWANGNRVRDDSLFSAYKERGSASKHLEIAKKEKRRFCLISEREKIIWNRIYFQKQQIDETRRFINQLKKEIHDGKFDEDLRTNARVLGKHGGRGERRNDQRQ